jgi:glycolate oxidase iron-sulfur subunit
VRDAHSCCGSAGTYSILQKGLSEQLRERKLDALQAGGPGAHRNRQRRLPDPPRRASGVPVVHWLELFDPVPAAGQPATS